LLSIRLILKSKLLLIFPFSLFQIVWLLVLLLNNASLPSPISRIWYINPYGHEIRPAPNPAVLSALSTSPFSSPQPLDITPTTPSFSTCALQHHTNKPHRLSISNNLQHRFPLHLPPPHPHPPRRRRRNRRSPNPLQDPNPQRLLRS